MMKRPAALTFCALFFLVLSLRANEVTPSPPAVPEDFPAFRIPGHEQEMGSLRLLHWMHYAGAFGGQRAQPLSTLWDEWMAAPSLWPAFPERMAANRQEWRESLSAREIDGEGYVSSDMSGGLAHGGGWPFPHWWQGRGGIGGWHFSFAGLGNWPGRGEKPDTPEGWDLRGLDDLGVGGDTWNLGVTEAGAMLVAPQIDFGYHEAFHPAPPEGLDAPVQETLDPFQSPFLQLRWRASGLENAQPYVEWRRAGDENFSAERRFYFSPVESEKVVRTMIPVYKHPHWNGEVTHLRVGLGNPEAGGEIGIQALFTQFDSRHNINSQSFITGCAEYFWWTRDLNFLRQNINRMRTALRHTMTVHKTLEEKVVVTGWVGHTGRAALRWEDGKKGILYGEGVGNNYWDLLPFGNEDCYATVRYFASLEKMERLEREILQHPEWNIPRGALAFDPDALERHRAEVKAEGNRRFWNGRTGRFVPGNDVDGNSHDYGATFLNLEAIHYGFATDEHAREILRWIDGERIVEGDTATGGDIYHWRFGPRSTTKRNTSYYGWYWWGGDTIPWGMQVQDGGAVLGFSYHDLMSRLRYLGSDNAWERLREIVAWFDDVVAAGGYRKFYAGREDASLQGGGTAGGLGMDHEFYESILLPQVMLNGFLGFTPTGDGFRINPRLPRDWPELTVDRIHLHDLVLAITARPGEITIRQEGGTASGPSLVELPVGEWRATFVDESGRETSNRLPRGGPEDGWEIDWRKTASIRFFRSE